MKPEDIAEEIGRSHATIYNWAELWNKNGWRSLEYKPSPLGSVTNFAETSDVHKSVPLQIYIHSFLEIYHDLIEDNSPITDRHSPFLGCVHYYQVKDLEQEIVSWE